MNKVKLIVTWDRIEIDPSAYGYLGREISSEYCDAPDILGWLIWDGESTTFRETQEDAIGITTDILHEYEYEVEDIIWDGSIR